LSSKSYFEWPIDGNLPSRVLYPDGKEPPGVHIDDVLKMLAQDTVLALEKLDAENELLYVGGQLITDELELKYRWFRGVAVVWEIATGNKPSVYLEGNSLSKDSLYFRKFIKAARMIHNGKSWPQIEDNETSFYYDYIKSQKLHK
tara:strand:- start:90 stop:524 length:435 start_codon:yes stop_codon:yes gene_type:complete